MPRIHSKNQDPLIRFGANLRAARNALDMTQLDLAEMMDLSRVSIHNMESGRHRPKLEDILKLCALLKKTPNELLPPLPIIQMKVKKEVKVTKKLVDKYSAKFKW